MYPFCFLGTRRGDGGCRLSAEVGGVGQEGQGRTGQEGQEGRNCIYSRMNLSLIPCEFIKTML